MSRIDLFIRNQPPIVVKHVVSQSPNLIVRSYSSRVRDSTIRCRSVDALL
jgi:hypothetical protein